MKMNTNITQRENLMTRTARFIRGVVTGGTASLVAAILAPNIHAEMLPGAIGNDGANGFDGSITATAHSAFDVRVPERAINGAGLEANGNHNSGGHWLGGTASPLPFWFIADLGQSYPLNRVHFYNYGNGLLTEPQNGAGSDRGVLTASIWLHDGATEPNGNNNNTAAFDSTGWSLHESNRAFTIAPATNPFGVTDIISLGDTQARFVALEITANHSTNGFTAFTGISEMQFFTTPATPFAVTNITVDPADLLEFNTDNGQDYRLEFTSNPTNTVWQEAGFIIHGDGGTRLAFDPAGVDTQKTYRIIPF